MNTKLNKVKELLAKMLEVENLEFASATTDKGVIFYDGEELAEGVKVYVEDAEGNKVAAEDGTYVIEEENSVIKEIEVVDGAITSIVEKSAEEEVTEEPVEEPTEEDKRNEVSLEEEVENPTNEGEESDTEAIVKLREEVNELYSIVDTLRKDYESLKTMVEKSLDDLKKSLDNPAVKPVTEEFEAMTKKTNTKGASRYTQYRK